MARWLFQDSPKLTSEKQWPGEKTHTWVTAPLHQAKKMLSQHSHAAALRAFVQASGDLCIHPACTTTHLLQQDDLVKVCSTVLNGFPFFTPPEIKNVHKALPKLICMAFSCFYLHLLTGYQSLDISAWEILPWLTRLSSVMNTHANRYKIKWLLYTDYDRLSRA